MNAITVVGTVIVSPTFEESSTTSTKFTANVR
jgi:hypothetical protein